MRCVHKKKYIEVSDLAGAIEFAEEMAINFRDKYGLGYYCAKQLMEILNLLEQNERIKIELIRTPFKNLKLAGFIGYKDDTIFIITNSNQTVGKERFTIAHEIYHLLQNRVLLKREAVIEEKADNNEDDLNVQEQMANCFAAELLIPKEDIKAHILQMTDNQTKSIEPAIVIQLQHKYGVDYIATTKRLKEIGLISDNKKQELDGILSLDGKLEETTKKLGLENELNTPSKDNFMMYKNFDIIKTNFENGHTTYDDLVRIFGYLGCTPEKFGYDNKIELSDDAKHFIKSLKN